MKDHEGTLRHPKTVAARRYGALLAVLMLVACGGTAASTVPASVPAVTPAATATDSVELTQVATVLAVPSTPLPGSASPVTITASPPADTPVVIVATPGARGATPAVTQPTVAQAATQARSMTPPTATPHRRVTMATVNARDDSGSPPPAASEQVVTVTASNGIRIRSKPSTDADAVAEVGDGNELTVIEADVPGSDGSSRWIRVRYAGKDGYVRSDLVGTEHAPSSTKPSATASASTTAPPTGAATATRAP